LAKDRLRKIALIGATGYEYGSPEARVESFPWDRLKKFRNLADYDFVNLNLPGMRTDMTTPAHQHHGRDAVGA
jgi:hypothetical protein